MDTVIHRVRTTAVAIVLIGASLAAWPSPAPVTHRLVLLNVTVTLDQVDAAHGAAAHAAVGQVDRVRIVYDADAVDPVTHRVRLLNFQHGIDGHYLPPRPDPVMMPMTDAWLDLGTRPYRMHFKAAVVHGDPILIDVDESTRRLTIHPQAQPSAVLISGPYVIDPTPLTGAEALAAGTTEAP
jgi:hypothetical protein